MCSASAAPFAAPPDWLDRIAEKCRVVRRAVTTALRLAEDLAALSRSEIGHTFCPPTRFHLLHHSSCRIRGMCNITFRFVQSAAVRWIVWRVVGLEV